MMVAKVKAKDVPRRLPGLISAKDMGRRIARALEAAGYTTQTHAVETIRRHLGENHFAKQDLSAMIQGNRLPRADRIMALVILLGLDLRILFPEAFDEDGRPITRVSHPDRFREGGRRMGRPGSRPTTARAIRIPSVKSG